MLDLSVIIVNYHTEELTLNCIDSIVKNTKGIKYEIIVVDSETNGKIQKSKNPKIQLIQRKENVGFTGGNNLGMREAKGDYVLLLNSDTEIHDNVLIEMVNWLNKNPKIGIATCALKNADGSIQGTGGYFPTLLRVFSWMTIQDFPLVDKMIPPFHPTKEKSFSKNNRFYEIEREMDWVTGAFMMIRREVINEIGYLDEDYFMYTEDTDYCFRAKQKNWKVVYNPKWSIIHLGGASSAKEFPVLSEYKNIKLFFSKHYSKWQYLPLRAILKIGALGRIVVLGTMRGGEYAKIYAKAFIEA